MNAEEMDVYFTIGGTIGLAVLNAAQIQPKNVSSVLIANLLSIAVATITFWACGYAFAVGDGTTDASNFFFSHTRFFLMGAKEKDYVLCVTNAVVLAFVIVIMNSGFISRLKCWIYPILVTLVSGFLYPCVYHWCRAPDGWLNSGILVGTSVLKYKDSHGCGYIHLFGGALAMFASIYIGPRREQREKRNGRRRLQPLGGNITPLIVLGGLLALVGLIAKNSIHPTTNVTSGQAMFNNLLAAQSSAVVAFILKRCKYLGDTSPTKALVNGAIAGVVSVSCAAHLYLPYSSFVIGVTGGLTYVAWSALLALCHIDDPTDSISVHFGVGAWGIIAAPIFKSDTGIIYTGSRLSMEILGWHILAGLAILVWAGITLLLIYLSFIPCSTYTRKDITKGLDELENNDPAFPSKTFVKDEPATSEELGYDNDVFNIIDLNKDGSFTLGPRAKFNGANTFHSASTVERSNLWDLGNDSQWVDATY